MPLGSFQEVVRGTTEVGPPGSRGGDPARPALGLTPVSSPPHTSLPAPTPSWTRRENSTWTKLWTWPGTWKSSCAGPWAAWTRASRLPPGSSPPREAPCPESELWLPPHKGRLGRGGASAIVVLLCVLIPSRATRALCMCAYASVLVCVCVHEAHPPPLLGMWLQQRWLLCMQTKAPKAPGRCRRRGGRLCPRAPRPQLQGAGSPVSGQDGLREVFPWHLVPVPPVSPSALPPRPLSCPSLFPCCCLCNLAFQKRAGPQRGGDVGPETHGWERPSREAVGTSGGSSCHIAGCGPGRWSWPCRPRPAPGVTAARTATEREPRFRPGGVMRILLYVLRRPHLCVNSVV